MQDYCYNVIIFYNLVYIVRGVKLNNNKDSEDNDHAKYIVIGMIIGLFLGVIFSIIMRNNTFFAISGTGFGLVFGLSIANIIWCLKKGQE